MEQQQFLSGVNQKKPIAWKNLYRYFYAALCAYAERITGNSSAAEDIVQECFISIWNSPVVFDEIKALKVYLFRSIYHNSLKYLRDAQVDSNRLQIWQELQQEGADEYFYQAVEEEVVRKLNLLIADLPLQQRKVLELSLTGMTIQAIAEKLEMTANTVKTHKKRAYAYLKEHLQDLYIYFPLLFLADNF